MSWGLWGIGVPGPGERTAMPTYYHVAPWQSRDSILQHGLDHTKGEHQWGMTPGNYFWENEDDAHEYADGMTQMARDDGGYDEDDEPGYVVLPFDHDGPVMDDPEGNHELARGRSFYTTDPIPASAFHRTAMPWYHVSPHDLPDGETLVPRGSPSPFEDSLYSDPDNEWRGDATWITDSPENARRWQKMLYNETGTYPEHLYEVEPEGRPEPQVYGDFYNAPPEYSVPSARIVRKIKPKKARIMSAAVTVYTQPNCIQCTMTKKQLDKLGIAHDTVDVSADPEAHAYVRGLGYTAAPVVVIGDGEEHWAGFKPDRLKGLVTGE